MEECSARTTRWDSSTYKVSDKDHSLRFYNSIRFRYSSVSGLELHITEITKEVKMAHDQLLSCSNVLTGAQKHQVFYSHQTYDTRKNCSAEVHCLMRRWIAIILVGSGNDARLHTEGQRNWLHQPQSSDNLQNWSLHEGVIIGRTGQASAVPKGASAAWLKGNNAYSSSTINQSAYLVHQKLGPV